MGLVLPLWGGVSEEGTASLGNIPGLLEKGLDKDGKGGPLFQWLLPHLYAIKKSNELGICE